MIRLERTFLSYVVAVLKSKYTELFIGTAMFGSAIFEIYEAFEAAEHNVGSHHGVALLGILTAIRCTAELLHGAKMVEGAEEESKKKPAAAKPKKAVARRSKKA